MPVAEAFPSAILETRWVRFVTILDRPRPVGSFRVRGRRPSVHAGSRFIEDRSARIVIRCRTGSYSATTGLPAMPGGLVQGVANGLWIGGAGRTSEGVGFVSGMRGLPLGRGTPVVLASCQRASWKVDSRSPINTIVNPCRLVPKFVRGAGQIELDPIDRRSPIHPAVRHGMHASVSSRRPTTTATMVR